MAVCSEADRGALHAELADVAVLIGPAEPAESYLRIDRILEVARETDADAIHPGYGFLAENADFARACADGGPRSSSALRAEVIDQMGEKTAARGASWRTPACRWCPGALLPEPDARGQLSGGRGAQAAATTVGYPLMVKAAFGGGGKGMRLVDDAGATWSRPAQAAAREAAGAFGDGTVYLEKFIERPRHVEFQIFGDAPRQRTCTCSSASARSSAGTRRSSRRSPSPALTPELREQMGAAAVAAAAAVGYAGRRHRGVPARRRTATSTSWR